MESKGYQARLQILGKTVQRLRKACGISQEKAAELSGLSTIMLCFVEQGRKAPSLNTLFALADTFDADVADFFEPSRRTISPGLPNLSREMGVSFESPVQDMNPSPVQHVRRGAYEEWVMIDDYFFRTRCSPENLRTLRKRAGLEREDIANAVDVTRQTVSEWESGKVLPAANQIEPYARVLGVTEGDVILSAIWTHRLYGN